MKYSKSPENFGYIHDSLSNYPDSRFVILPIPYEKTTTYMKGTANGPKAIIRASQNMELYPRMKGIFGSPGIKAKIKRTPAAI